jgi:hypothetical protein
VVTDFAEISLRASSDHAQTILILNPALADLESSSKENQIWEITLKTDLNIFRRVQTISSHFFFLHS